MSDSVSIVQSALSETKEEYKIDDELLRKIILTWLNEYKCPARKRFYGRIPLYYYDQIQGILALAVTLVFVDFCVYTPKYTHVQRFRFNEKYWKEVLFPGIYRFYMEEYLPRKYLQYLGKLEYGEIEPVVKITSQTCTGPQLLNIPAHIPLSTSLEQLQTQINSQPSNQKFPNTMSQTSQSNGQRPFKRYKSSLPTNSSSSSSSSALSNETTSFTPSLIGLNVPSCIPLSSNSI